MVGLVAKYQRYAEYKDSGIVWMGNVPKHWTSERFKWSLTEKLKTSNPNLPAGSISFGEVIYKNEENLSSDTKASYQEVLKDEFLINPLNLNYDLKSLRTALSKIDVVVSTGYIVLHCNHLLDRNYVRWLLQEFDVAHMKTLGAGVRQTVNFSDIANCYFYLPEQLEQRKIAHFLDHETAKIDSLIAKQQQLIELLKEKRQAVISHAVTKGLNPNVPMKDSGVEWLGQVPEHWEVRQLRYLGTCQNGINIGAEYFGSGSPFISYGDVYRNPELPTVFDGLVQSTENDRKIYSVRSGDVLFTRTSETIEEIGFSSTCLNDVKNATFAGFLIRFRPVKNTLLPEYSKFYFRNILLRAFFVKEMNLVTRASLSQELLKKLAVPFPSLEEQKKIADFLHSKDQIFDKLINDCKKQIELLKERRTALISAAVTGKIDVRNWQNPTEAKMEFSA